jgi:hypothetical protein
MWNKSKILAVLAVALIPISMTCARAHGSGQPRHGGIVQVANHINFELVVEANAATLYLVEHDTPMPTQGISGKMTVLSGQEKTEVDIKPIDGNKLQATGVKIGRGAKVVAVLNNVGGKTTTVRFAVK